MTTVNGAAIGAINQSTNTVGDFIHLSGIEKEFSEGEKVQSFRILFNNDSTLEHDESFLVKLESLVPQYTNITPYDSAKVTIKNDDSGLCVACSAGKFI